MNIRASYTSAELREVARLSRSRFFWLRFLLVNWYGALLTIGLISIAANAITHHQKVPWTDVLMVLAAIAFIYAFAWFRYTSKLARLAARSASRNRTATLESDGIHTQAESGATAFVPWTSFDRCQEGKLIFLLKGINATMAIPCDDANRDMLRNFLRSNIATQLLE